MTVEQVVDRTEHYRGMEQRYALSPFHQVLGLSLQVGDDGAVTIHYDGRPEGGNRRGHMAGGAIAAMIDSAVMQACFARLDEGDMAVTLEFKINFMRPGKPGEHLRALGAMEYIGRTTALGVGRVVDDSGKLLALGTVTVSIKRAPPAG